MASTHPTASCFEVVTSYDFLRALMHALNNDLQLVAMSNLLSITNSCVLFLTNSLSVVSVSPQTHEGVSWFNATMTLYNIIMSCAGVRICYA